jgi:hypothetical protein
MKDDMQRSEYIYIYIYVCVCVCARAHVLMGTHLCVCVGLHMGAVRENKILFHVATLKLTTMKKNILVILLVCMHVCVCVCVTQVTMIQNTAPT